jgi:hypothetical protein
MRKTLPALILTLAGLSIAQPASAERDRTEFPWERASLSVGYFFTSFASDAKVETGGVGAIVNLEEVLGLDDVTHQFRIQAMGRLWRKHRFYFSYYDLSREASKTLDTAIPTDPPIDVGALVETEFDLRIYKVSYTYSFFQDDRLDIHGGMGFFIMDIGLGLKAQTSGDGGTLAEAFAQETTLPLPVFNLGMDVAILPKLFLKNSLDFFYVEVSGFEGMLLDANVALEYDLFKYFGLGLGFDLLRVDISGDADDSFLGGGWEGDLEFNYSGLQVYGKFYF